LKALLPESGTDIKGHMRSHAELLAASGYTSRLKEFDNLIRILDGEIRLITPTDPEGADNVSSQVQAGEKYYQLTHDYLVHSLRDWLTRKQKETRRGRAELLLADRAAVWNARPENRQLPSLLQWFQIRWLTQKKHWMPPQRKMMRKAGKYHAVRAVVVALILGFIGLGSLEGYGRLKAHTLRDRLLESTTADVPGIVKEMGPYRWWLNPLLQEAFAQAQKNKDARKQLHASLALLPEDATQVEYLYHQLLDAQPHQVPVVRDFLADYKSELVGRLWRVAEQPDPSKESQRLRAAAALATYDPESAQWAKVREAVANDLVRVPAVYLAAWLESFRAVRAQLWTPLAAIFREASRRDAERSLAAGILADYAADQPQLLADLLLDADENQFAVLYAQFDKQGERGLPMLASVMDSKLPADTKDDAKEKLAKRQANAAVTLLRMNQPAKVWSLLKHSPDPRARSYLIHRLSPLRANAEAIIQRLDEEPDVTIRRALLLSLGEYGNQELSSDLRQTLLPKVQNLYRTASDPGVHGAAEWFLRNWQQQAWLKQVNEQWAQDKAQRQQRLQSIEELVSKAKAKAPPQWYVNSQGQTMVVIPGPVEFLMGSPSTEERWDPTELQHKQRIGRMFAIAAKSVTLEQYRKFEPRYGVGEIERWARTPDSPVLATNWYQAVAYCNWLSQQEGLPESEWCYEPLVDRKAIAALADSSAGLLAGSFGPLVATGGLVSRRIDPGYRAGMKLAQNYLQRRGYRLPTGAEWEYACRAGAVTSRYYGETEELLEKYAWCVKNGQERTWPVGSKKPNDLGLFDMHGNVWTWCQERFKNYSQGMGEKAIEDKEDNLSIKIQEGRVLRGGSFADLAVYVRSAARSGNVPGARNSPVGFRPARTFTAD
jgi:formylglycine-generating enzyme required for sulfatase activity